MSDAGRPPEPLGGRRPADEAARDRVRRELSASFVVDAGAGTGKTRLLLDRLLALVLGEGVALSRMAVITFTEKAAAELKERLRVRLEEAAEEGPSVKSARRALRDLEQASLTTLHAFCAGLLRERAVEAGVDPRFSVLDAPLAARLEEEAFGRWCREALGSPVPELSAFHRLGGVFDQVRRMKDFLVGHRAAFVPPAEVPDPSFQALEEEAGRILQDLTRRVETGCRKGDDRLARFAEDFRRALRDLHALPPEERSFEAVERLKAPGGKLGAKGNWKDEGALEEARALVARLQEVVAAFDGRLRDAALRRVLVWLSSYLPRLAEEKARRGVLDFDDLLERTRNLLRDRPDVREELKGRYDRIFVDEFQDTDPLQAEIVFYLAEEKGRSAKHWREVELESGKVFVVGDPQQSIYRFRRADVETYQQAKRLLSERGASVETLTENFRTVAPVLSFVNEAFAPLLSPSGLPFSPLTPARREPLPEDAAPPLAALPVAGPHPAPAQAEGGRDRSLEEESSGEEGEEREPLRAARAREAEAVAAFLAETLKAGRWTVEDPGTGVRRPLRAGDVAVLFREIRNAEASYEEALRRRGVPFRVVGGRRFFHRPEVAALESLLACLASPTDEAAGVAVLRSPLFGVPDGELLLHRGRGGSFRFWEEAPGPVGEAFRKLREWHQALAERTPSEGLGFLLEHTNLAVVAACQPHGLSRLANLWKLREQARSLESQGPFSYGAFARWLKRQRVEEVEEEEAPPPEGGDDRVTLMTVHQAKGLEFPLVVVSGFAASRPRPQAFRIDRRSGAVEARVGSREGRLETVGYAELQAREAALQEAEERRLLYVACTRARDCLVLPVPEKLPAGHFLTPLLACGDLPGFVRLAAPAPEDGGDPPALVVDLPPEAASSKEVEEAVRALSAAREAWREKVAALSGGSGERSVTEALGGGEEAEGERARLGDEGVDLRRKEALAFGGLVHRLLEKGWDWDPKTLERAAPLWAAGEGLAPSRGREAAARASRFLSGELAARARKSGAVFREVPVAAVEGGGVLAGVVDLAFEEEDGWVVVDYKTDVKPDLDAYERQVRAYARMLERATGKRVKEGYLCVLSDGPAEEVRVKL